MKALYLNTAFLFLVLVHFGMIGLTENYNRSSNLDLKEIRSSDVVDFLVNSSDLHLMALKEGEVAIEKGTVADVKAYGERPNRIAVGNQRARKITTNQYS